MTHSLVHTQSLGSCGANFSLVWLDGDPCRLLHRRRSVGSRCPGYEAPQENVRYE
jgi:hypothetical protein